MTENIPAKGGFEHGCELRPAASGSDGLVHHGAVDVAVLGERSDRAFGDC